jgi:transcription termination/antitermination protein NusG
MTAKFEYSVGEMVRIKTGAFQNFTARIEEVDQEKALLKVRVKIFGRTQPIELTFLDVEKIAFREEE